MYIIGPVRTAHFGRCRSFPNRFRIRRKAAADLGGGYFFRSMPNLIAAITSISNAMVSAVLMRSPPLRGNNRTVLTGEPHHTRFALLCQFSAPPAGRLLLCAPHPLFYAERVGSPVGPAGGLTSGFFPVTLPPSAAWCSCQIVHCREEPKRGGCRASRMRCRSCSRRRRGRSTRGRCCRCPGSGATRWQPSR